ncbi:MAG: lysine--tRNA ligase [Candidatus Omnitrophica bacterium]|nr:lysine--tRNA ligase [Candidatus Omnitrophota bacterium]
MTEDNEQIQIRKQHLDAIRALGFEPYGGREPGIQPITQVLADFKEGTAAKIAGRIMAWRSFGKAIFVDLLDSAGRMQIYIKKTQLDPKEAELVSHLDLGDMISATGELFTTKTGMATLQVSSIRILSKALHPPPEKWHGLKDVETRYRQRYADLAGNAEVREIFRTRSRVVSEIRRFLDERGYLEVETPMMHSIAGGAAGKPFRTHHEALDIDLYMRIAPELYLKRLLVGGLERVYEINKSFRNEGISTRHNPEFTMLEVYTAFFDAEDTMDLCEGIIRSAALRTRQTEKINWQGMEIDLSVFERVSFSKLMEEAYGILPDDDTPVWAQKLKARGVNLAENDLSRTKLLKIIGELIEPAKRKHPVFVTDYFTELCPLAKRQKNDPRLSERFELYIGGIEIANGYSELNDPSEQMERFRADLDEPDGDIEGKIDTDFVRALEYGMPPAGGLGIGVDRLVMALTDQPTIREVILFPQMKPQRH